MPRWVNLANLFTLIRLACVPFAVQAILRQQHGRALALVLFAGLTDTIDGTLARRFGMATSVGAYLDPITDKIYLSAVFIALAMISSVPRWLVIEIFARDVLILAGAGISILFLRMRQFPPSVWGKASTFLQIFCALVVMIGNAAPGSFAARWAPALFWPVAALTAFSGLHYLWRIASKQRGRDVVSLGSARLTAAAIGLLVTAAGAQSSQPCDRKVAEQAKPKDGNVRVCLVSRDLVPGRAVALAVVEFDDMKRHGGQIEILDLQQLQAGKPKPLYQDSSSEGITPFLFHGAKTPAAIADFDRSRRIGFALLYLGDTGAALKIQTWDESASAFRPVHFWTDHEYDWLEISGDPGTIEIGDGLIRVGSCRAGWRGKRGVYPIVATYKLQSGRYVFDRDEANPKGKPSTDSESCSNGDDPRLK